MRKSLKKAIASVMAATTLSMCTTGISASAISDTVQFHKTIGEPSSSIVVFKDWSYTTSLSKSRITVTNFSATDSATYIYSLIKINNITQASGNIYPTGGSIEANQAIGSPAYASAEVINKNGNISATVSISG